LSYTEGVLIPFLLLVCSTAFSETRPFTFRLIAEPTTFDWNKASTPVETHLLMNLMEGLVELDAKLEVVPALAARWERSADGRIYTFHLREDARWSDGQSVRAQDFVASWKRLLSAETAAPYAYFLFDLKNAEDFYKGKIKDFAQVGVKVKDDRTLVVELAQPVAHWIYMPTFWVTFPVREDLLKQYGAQFFRPGKMVSTGAFVLKEHITDSKVSMEKNPHYRRAEVRLPKIEGLVVADHSTALTLFESGRLDFMTDISPLDLERLEGKPELKAFPYLKTVYLGLVVTHPSLKDARVRRALGHAIDRSRFGAILHGRQERATSFVTRPMQGYDPNVGLRHDVALAKTLFKQAGVKPESLKLTLVTQNWDKTMTVAQYLQEELRRNLGVQVELLALDNKAYQAATASKAEPLFLRSWGADYPDPDNFLSVFQSDSGNNRTGWKNAQFDALVKNARTQVPGKKRIANYLTAQKILQEKETAIIPLYYEPNLTLVHSRVQGLELTPLNYLFLRGVSLGLQVPNR
jgi:oligopeptide transport system substrate-binding protein